MILNSSLASASLISSIVARWVYPALFTTTSIRPNFFLVWSRAAFTASSSLMFKESGKKPSPSGPNTFTSVYASRLVAATGYPSSSSFLTSAWPSPFEQPVTNQTFLLVIFFSFPNQILHIRMVPGVFLTIEQFPVVFQFLIQNSQTAFHLLHFLQGPLPLCLHDLIAFCKRSVALLIERNITLDLRQRQPCLAQGNARVYLRSQKCWDIRQKAPDARRMSAALLGGMQANQQMGLFGRIEQRWGVFRYTLTKSHSSSSSSNIR